MFSPKRILVPTDYSKFSDKALKHAVDIAKEHNSRIYLLHVVGIIQACVVDYCFDNATIADLERKSVQAAQDMMQKQIKRIMKDREIEIIPDVKQGIPYEEILKEQEAKKMDLIVIASHGSTGLLHYLIGSVAEKVTKGAKCPVLLVKN